MEKREIPVRKPSLSTPCDVVDSKTGKTVSVNELLHAMNK